METIIISAFGWTGSAFIILAYALTLVEKYKNSDLGTYLNLAGVAGLDVEADGIRGWGVCGDSQSNSWGHEWGTKPDLSLIASIGFIVSRAVSRGRMFGCDLTSQADLCASDYDGVRFLECLEPNAGRR